FFGAGASGGVAMMRGATVKVGAAAAAGGGAAVEMEKMAAVPAETGTRPLYSASAVGPRSSVVGLVA
ncbi:hypothetical protein BC828DRAFT_408397, partial [Blastocladiella britannica]